MEREAIFDYISQHKRKFKPFIYTEDCNEKLKKYSYIFKLSSTKALIPINNILNNTNYILCSHSGSWLLALEFD